MHTYITIYVYKIVKLILNSQFNTQIAYHCAYGYIAYVRLYCIGKIFQHFFAIKFYIQSNYCYKRPQK